MVSDSGATAEAYEKANPITVVVIAPEYTSFASDDTITASLVGNSNGSGIASSADAVTITHLDNLGDQQVISISGLDNYLKNSSISIPVVVNADAPAGAAIASSNTIFVQPSATLSGTASNGTKFDQLTTLGSVTADLNAGTCTTSRTLLIKSWGQSSPVQLLTPTIPFRVLLIQPLRSRLGRSTFQQTVPLGKRFCITGPPQR